MDLKSCNAIAADVCLRAANVASTYRQAATAAARVVTARTAAAAKAVEIAVNAIAANARTPVIGFTTPYTGNADDDSKDWLPIDSE